MAKAKTLADKLLIKPGAKVALVNAPPGLQDVEGAESAPTPKGAAAVLLFVADEKDLRAHLGKVKKALGAEARLWIAYPKAGQLGTDLDRDILFRLVQPQGLQGVRQVAIDETWSAMMFLARE